MVAQQGVRRLASGHALRPFAREGPPMDEACPQSQLYRPLCSRRAVDACGQVDTVKMQVSIEQRHRRDRYFLQVSFI
jgi:hypothetical protein